MAKLRLSRGNVFRLMRGLLRLCLRPEPSSPGQTVPARGRYILPDCEAKHDAICVEYQRERKFFTCQARAKLVTVELFGASHIRSGYERNDFVVPRPDCICTW